MILCTEFQPPRSHDSALLLLHAIHSGGRKTTLTTMKLSNRACVQQSELSLTLRANTSKFCRAPLMTLCSSLFSLMLLFFKITARQSAQLLPSSFFFYVNPQRLSACSFPKYPARTFSTFTS